MKHVNIKKETLKRLHKHGHPGEKHDNLINRLLDVCVEDEKNINLSDETVEKIILFTGCRDIDEALNVLLDKYGTVVK